jgi:hypothetical protein
MGATRHSVDQIIAKLIEAESSRPRVLTIRQSWRRPWISDQRFHRWRMKYPT